MDVFKANVRIRSTAKALAILASHRREKYFVLRTISIRNVCEIHSSNQITVSNLPQKVSKKSREKVEKRVGKSVKKKSLEKMRTRKKKRQNANKTSEEIQN